MGPDELCGSVRRVTPVFTLRPFISNIMKLKFDELPDYDHLRFLLQKVLLDENMTPSKHFEWIPKPVHVP